MLRVFLRNVPLLIHNHIFSWHIRYKTKRFQLRVSCFSTHHFNLLRLSGFAWHQINYSTLVPVIVWRVFATKSLPKPLMAFCPRKNIGNVVCKIAAILVRPQCVNTDIIGSACMMGATVSQITSLTIVYSTVYSGEDQRKHWPLCGNSAVTGEFPAQMVSNAENYSFWWRHLVSFYVSLRLPLIWYLRTCVPEAGIKFRNK